MQDVCHFMQCFIRCVIHQLRVEVRLQDFVKEVKLQDVEISGFENEFQMNFGFVLDLIKCISIYVSVKYSFNDLDTIVIVEKFGQIDS